MAKEKLKISASSAGSDEIIYTNEARANEFLKIEACYSALNAAKAFALSFKSCFKETGNTEVDSYIKNIVEQTDKKTINFLNFSNQVLDFIHHGVSGVRVVWQEDENGLPFPAESFSIETGRIANRKGRYYDRQEDKIFDPALFYFTAEQLTAKSFKCDLLDAIEPVCKIIMTCNKTLLPAIRKYKNPPKVTIIPSTSDPKTDKTNCETAAENMSGLNENSSVAMTGVEKIISFALADIEKIQRILDASDLKIFRAYLGHSEAIQGAAGGNNTKMLSILKIVYHYSIFRASLLENTINQLLENIVHARWGYSTAVPYLKFDLKSKPDDETLFKWYQAGVALKKSLVYEALGGEPDSADSLQKKESSRGDAEDAEKERIDKDHSKYNYGF